MAFTLSTSRFLPSFASFSCAQRMTASIDKNYIRLINNGKGIHTSVAAERDLIKCASLWLVSSPSHLASIPNSFLSCRDVFYAPIRLKSKDKGGKAGKGGKGGKGGGRVRFDDAFSEVIDDQLFQTELEEVFEQLSTDLADQCTVKSGAAAFDRLVVNTVDGEFSLNELGTITQKSASLIVVNMSSLPNYIPDVVAAIHSSNLNVNPQQDGSQITLPLPKITKDHRERLAADAKKRLELMKVDCRRIYGHHSSIAKKKKDAGISEDAIFMVDKWIKQEMDVIIAKAESLVKEKQAEVLDATRG